jgi:low affinity Fe/Cu permease
MSSLLALLAGAAAKLYDDLDDNNLLQKFRISTLMEFLKGLHYITFTSLSIEEPMFFIIQYLSNILHSFGNKGAFSKPYDNSLLYSFLLLFIIIDYKKITSFCLSDKLISIIFIMMFAVEPLISFSINPEYSFIKMITRSVTVILYIILNYFSISNTIKYITSYIIGYLFISVLVQFYSLRMEKLKLEEEKEEKEVKEEEVKEVKEEVEVKEVKEIKEKEIKEIIEEVEEEVKEKEI